MEPGTCMVLMVMTSCSEMENGEPTGLWLEEFSVPYDLFIRSGCEVTLASPGGGRVPVDARSLADETKPENADEALELLESTVKLSEIDPEKWDAVFFPGGHGTMFDLPQSEETQDLIRSFVESGKPTALVCHGPAALVQVTGSEGKPLVQGKKVTGFTNEEEAAVNLTEQMPFLLESRLKELGGIFSSGGLFQAHVVVDGNLITGQNPPSSAGAARQLIQLLNR